MDMNMLLNEKYGIVGAIYPTAALDAHNTGYIDMSKFDELLAIMIMGNMSAHTIDFAAYASPGEAGTNEAVVKEITQLTNSASANDSTIVGISLRNEDLLAKSGTYAMRYVRFRVTATSQTGYSAVIVLGKPKAGLGAASNLAAVGEIEDDLS